MAPVDLPNMIVVEGGPRAIKKYKRLMLRRVNWNEKSKKRIANNEEGSSTNPEQESVDTNQQEEIDGVKESRDRQCFLVWEGLVKKKTFDKWRVVDIRSENEAKRLLAERGCEHYWSMIANFHSDRAQGDLPDELDKALL